MPQSKLDQKKSAAQRKREFQEKYNDWIAEQNRQTEQCGLWLDGAVTWASLESCLLSAPRGRPVAEMPRRSAARPASFPD